MSHLITFNCTNVRPQTDFFIGFHSSLTFCTVYACAKGQFSIKTQFHDLVRFIAIYSMFVPNLEPIGSSSQIKDTKYHFFSKWQNTHALNHLSVKIVSAGLKLNKPCYNIGYALKKQPPEGAASKGVKSLFCARGSVR